MRFLYNLILFLFAFLGTAQIPAKDEFSHAEIAGWEAYGKGEIEKNHKQTVMWEKEGAVGYMLVSPKSYQGDVRVSYDVMPLNAGTVLIVELHAHDSSNFSLDFSEDYNGNVDYLFDSVNMYMFAFHNAAHNKSGPFVRKWPAPGRDPLTIAKKHYFEVGKYHHVELGIEMGVLFFEVNGKKVWKIKDENPYAGGKVILRIRGTAYMMGGCIFKNLSIEAADSN